MLKSRGVLENPYTCSVFCIALMHDIGCKCLSPRAKKISTSYLLA